MALFQNEIEAEISRLQKQLKDYKAKKKKAAKCRVNGVSGTLCGKTLFFPRFF